MKRKVRSWGTSRNDKKLCETGEEIMKRYHAKYRRVETDRSAISRIFNQIKFEKTTGRDIRVDVIQRLDKYDFFKFSRRLEMENYEFFQSDNYKNEPLLSSREQFYDLIFKNPSDPTRVFNRSSYRTRTTWMSKKRLMIDMMMKKFSKDDLKKIVSPYLSTCAVKYPQLKDQQAEFIYSLMSGNVMDSEKRKIEKENLVEVHQIFVLLCGVQIPSDVMLEILDFLPRNRNVLDTVGCACESLYLLLLLSWKNIRISRNTVRRIPLVVLRNVKKVSIWTIGITKMDFQHVLKNAHSVQCFRFMDCNRVNNFFRYVQQPLRSVVKLSIRNLFGVKMEKKNFPNLRKLVFRGFHPKEAVLTKLEKTPLMKINWKLPKSTVKTLKMLQIIVFKPYDWGTRKCLKFSDHIKFYLPREFKKLKKNLRTFEFVPLQKKIMTFSFSFSLSLVSKAEEQDVSFKRISRMNKLTKLVLMYPDPYRDEQGISLHHVNGIELCVQKIKSLEEVEIQTTKEWKGVKLQSYLTFDTDDVRTKFFESVNNFPRKNSRFVMKFVTLVNRIMNILDLYITTVKIVPATCDLRLATSIRYFSLL